MTAVCELSFSDHNRDDTCADPVHAKALEARRAARRAGAPPWSTLDRHDEGINGWRDYVYGKVVHCGQGLELQSTESKEDDYGGFLVYLPTGLPVRYETSGEHVVLYADIGGQTFTCRAEPWMRFRWLRQ